MEEGGWGEGEERNKRMKEMGKEGKLWEVEGDWRRRRRRERETREEGRREVLRVQRRLFSSVAGTG